MCKEVEKSLEISATPMARRRSCSWQCKEVEKSLEISGSLRSLQLSQPERRPFATHDKWGDNPGTKRPSCNNDNKFRSGQVKRFQEAPGDGRIGNLLWRRLQSYHSGFVYVCPFNNRPIHVMSGHSLHNTATKTSHFIHHSTNLLTGVGSAQQRNKGLSVHGGAAV